MEQKAFIVSGLGYGDEGKGTVTHWLSSLYGAHTVIRTGGPQALHRVVTKNGADHVFSQFGSGTLRGSATHLSSRMIIDPHAILKEGEHLKYAQGIRNIFDILTIHENALVITPFQAIGGRLRELLRGENRYGSIGIGVGETALDVETLGDAVIRAKDLGTPRLREKLHVIRQHKLIAFEEIRDRASYIPPEVRERVLAEITELEDPDTLEWAVERFAELVKLVKIVDTDYVARNILNIPGTIIFEGSQGVLLDRFWGFHPHTTKVRTTPGVALDLLEECAYAGDIKSLGVLRAYHTRHGAGPFVTESPSLTEQLPDVTNGEHPWQGKFRAGSFDAVAARYALKAVGRKLIDGLVITCLDRLKQHKTWEVCDAYMPPDDMPEAQSFFQNDGVNIINIIPNNALENGVRLERQAELGRVLRRCTPKNTTFDIPLEKKRFFDLCVSTLETTLHCPIVAVSVGPTECDKIAI